MGTKAGRQRARVVVVVAMAALVGAVPPLMRGAHAQRHRSGGRYLVQAHSAADLEALKAELPEGATLDTDLAEIGVVAVTADASAANDLAGDTHVASIAALGVRRVIEPEHERDRLTPKATLARRSAPTAPSAPVLHSAQWNIDRVDAPSAQRASLGAGVVVGVADTGIDANQPELAGRVSDEVDLTATEDPSLCGSTTGLSDADLAGAYGLPASSDWNGHGTFVAGLLAGTSSDGSWQGVAPAASLVDIKIAQWCGLAADDAILKAILYAADHGVDVLNISIGGYVDRRTPDGDALYNTYAAAVTYARRKGTLIVAAAGNDHVRVGAGGVVLSHGSLMHPGDTTLTDLYGLYDIPAGLPGVVMVSATANEVGAPSDTCADGTADGAFPTCKPTSDVHQPSGVGATDQLAYYSNYGPRIDIAAPGGARQFNLPGADRGGAPASADGTTTYGVVSIVSDTALGPDAACLQIDGLTPGRCYNVLQGTSFASPLVAGVAALAIAAAPALRDHPRAIVDVLQHGARDVVNATPKLSASDTSPGDSGGPGCATGYCHLGGKPIRSEEAYGAGVVDATGALQRLGVS